MGNRILPWIRSQRNEANLVSEDRQLTPDAMLYEEPDGSLAFDSRPVMS
jgi:hypothetical protein